MPLYIRVSLVLGKTKKNKWSVFYKLQSKYISYKVIIVDIFFMISNYNNLLNLNYIIN